MSKTLKADIILTVSVILAAAVLLCIFAASGGQGQSVSITVNGELFGKYSLSADKTVDVYGLCTVRIENGAVYILNSTCKNQTCVHHAPISRAGDSIICLPNGVILTVGETDVDFVI